MVRAESVLDARFEEESQEVTQKIQEEYQAFQRQCEELEHPFQEEEAELYRRSMHLKMESNRQVAQEDMEVLKKYYPNHSSLSFVKDKLKGCKNTEDLLELRKFIHNTHQESFMAKVNQWKKQKIAELQKEFEKRIEAWLERIRQAKSLKKSLGEAEGLFGDLEQEAFNSLDLSNLEDKEYGERIVKARGVGKERMDAIIRSFQQIRDSQSLQKICDLLGALERKEQIERTKKIMEQKSYTFNEEILSKDYKEEIVGVSLGRDLENLLPQELGILDDEDLEVLFHLKFVQNRLFCFEKIGYISHLREEQYEEEKEVPDEEDSQNKGAMIICVDTSSSMYGEPEMVAKAVTLYLAARAKKQKRPCFLINFSDQIECMEFGEKGGIGELNDFLNKSFNGGTDIAPALRKGIEKMQEPQFEKSDLLFVSDGGFGGISDDLKAKVREQQKEDNRFYLLDVGSFSFANDLFDKHWQYDPSTQNIEVLYDMEEITKNR